MQALASREVVVHADADDVSANRGVGHIGRIDGEPLRPQIVVHVFCLGRPFVRQREFHAATQRPAGEPLGLAVHGRNQERHAGEEQRHGARVDGGLHRRLANRQTALHVEQRALPRVAEPARDEGEPIHLGIAAEQELRGITGEQRRAGLAALGIGKSIVCLRCPPRPGRPGYCIRPARRTDTRRTRAYRSYRGWRVNQSSLANGPARKAAEIGTRPVVFGPGRHGRAVLDAALRRIRRELVAQTRVHVPTFDVLAGAIVDARIAEPAGVASTAAVPRPNWP